ncbi:MAG: LL-diaminopimelate aminotransferase [Pelotomaculum sp. PtaU1.Bin035]|nr:MAG: LL-diaminopimelate aminotransferase [Pelotomaculum sp. PtaU1.Bin035]
MPDSFVQNMFAERIGGSEFGKDTVIYKFEKIKRAKSAARKAHPGVEIIDLGVGEPDEMADMGIVAILAEEAAKPENRGYSDNGIQEFKDAAAKHLDMVYGVKGLNPETEIIHGIGSKPVLAMLPAVFINPGDIAIMPVPNYPVLGTLTKWFGGQVVNLPITPENGFFPDIDSLDRETRKKAKLLYLNYPNNPTGACATREFFEKVVKFAKENDIVVVHDAAYAGLVFDGEKPLAFLSVEGAKDVGIELFSLSKAYNMTGWRLAAVAGNELIIKGFATVKDNNDSGQFIAIQKAGIYALEHPEITEKISEKYSRRHNMLVSALNEVGFSAKKPKGSFYLYVKAPKGIKGGRRFENAEDFSQHLIAEKLISTVPWDDAGSYVRFSVTFIADGIEEEKRVIDEVRKRLSDVDFEF